MLEILQSIITIFLITINCYFPKKYCLSFIGLKKTHLSFVEQLSLGTVIHIFSLLILSFLTLFSQKIILIYFFLLFFHNIIFILKEKIEITNFKLESFFLFFIIFILAVYFLNNFVIGWDAQNYWVNKALTILNDNSIENLKYTTRPEYPHLGSFIWSFYTKFSLINNELYGRIFYIYFFCLSLIYISEVLSKNKKHNLMFFCFLILVCFKTNIFNGYQEILIFSFFVIITREFYVILNNKTSNNLKELLVIIISCSSISWIKSEGMILALLFLVTLIIYYKTNIKKQLLVFFFALIIIISRFLYLNQIDAGSSFQSGNYEFFDLLNITDYISTDRIFLIIKYFIIGSFQNLIFLFSILCSTFMIINTKSIKEIKYHLLYLLFCLIFIFTAYLFTNIPLEFHLKNSIDRLFLQISGFFIIFLIITYRKLYK